MARHKKFLIMLLYDRVVRHLRPAVRICPPPGPCLPTDTKPTPVRNWRDEVHSVYAQMITSYQPPTSPGSHLRPMSRCLHQIPTTAPAAGTPAARMRHDRSLQPTPQPAGHNRKLVHGSVCGADSCSYLGVRDRFWDNPEPHASTLVHVLLGVAEAVCGGTLTARMDGMQWLR